MPKATHELLAIYVDGETKTGKGAAGKAIAMALKNRGLKIYYDVAGDFFRRYVALVRLQLGLAESDQLATGKALQAAAEEVLAGGKPFEKDEELGDLQRPAISQSVAVLSELALVQQAGGEWWARSLRLATKAGAEVVVLDGRNPRNRVRDAMAATSIDVRVALDIFMTCEAKEAARRALRLEGMVLPSAEELEAATKKVVQRRVKDRQRSEQPFLTPKLMVDYDPENMTAEYAVRKSWLQAEGASELPLAIKIDNTYFSEPEMLTAVKDLAITALEYIGKQ